MVGCGSIAGTIIHPVPYAGVQADATLARDGGAKGCICVLDLPATAIVDTVLLIFTFPYAYATWGDRSDWAVWWHGPPL